MRKRQRLYEKTNLLVKVDLGIGKGVKFGDVILQKST